MIDRIFVGDYGTLIVVDCGVELDDFDDIYIEVMKPDMNVVLWRDIIKDGKKVKYIAKSGDFNIAGKYRCQVVLSNSVGMWRSSCFFIDVYEKFDA